MTAEVFQFPKKPKSEKENEAGKGPLLEQDGKKAILNYDSATKLLFALATLLKDIKRGATYKLNLSIVHKYSDEEITGWINNSNELQWKEKPLFFSAVVDEAISRGLLQSTDKG